MMIERIRIRVDKKHRKEQAGFRAKRSKIEQIFILRNILEQANKWRVGLNIHFVDFEKAFDLVHRGSLWNILRSYGIPSKMARVIAGVYEGLECAVIDESETSDWFKIKSRVKQGCMTSGFSLFTVAPTYGNSPTSSTSSPFTTILSLLLAYSVLSVLHFHI